MRGKQLKILVWCLLLSRSFLPRSIAQLSSEIVYALAAQKSGDIVLHRTAPVWMGIGLEFANEKEPQSLPRQSADLIQAFAVQSLSLVPRCHECLIKNFDGMNLGAIRTHCIRLPFLTVQSNQKYLTPL